MKNKPIKIIAYLLIVLLLGAVGYSYFYKDQINVVLMGIEGKRTDTLLFVTLDTKDNTAKILSIPRDTYNPTEGKNGLGQKKINAVYGFKEIGGPEGVADSVENLLGVTVDHFIEVDYDAVAAIVELIGGVEVDVPYRMKYDDIYATPPLHIDFEPGVQVITGNEAMAYLRFRKSNDGKINGGDVMRIERQQDFLKNAAKKLVTPKLPYIAYKAMEYVETDISAFNGSLLAVAMLGINADKVEIATLPESYVGKGNDGLSYFFHDSEATKLLMDEWMN